MNRLYTVAAAMVLLSLRCSLAISSKLIQTYLLSLGILAQVTKLDEHANLAQRCSSQSVRCRKFWQM